MMSVLMYADVTRCRSRVNYGDKGTVCETAGLDFETQVWLPVACGFAGGVFRRLDFPISPTSLTEALTRSHGQRSPEGAGRYLL